MTTDGFDRRPPTAIVWIDDRHATVARSGDGDRLSIAEVDRGTDPEAQYLARVVHELGAEARVMIVGANRVRLALEREFVAISHHPECLVATTPSIGAAGSEAIDRSRSVAA